MSRSSAMRTVPGRPERGQNIRGAIRPNNSGGIFQISSRELASVVSLSLHRHASHSRYPHKIIARAAQTNVRTAKNLYEGRNAPNALTLLRLMTAVPELQAEVRRLTGMLTDMDPAFERAFTDALTAYQRLR